MAFLKKLADNTSTSSLSHKYRFQRFLFFESLISQLPRPIKILDIGGTQAYWEAMNLKDKNIEIVLLNLDVQPCSNPNITSVKGDATNLIEYKDKSFDIVYSNSCIEHLFTWENQQKMAKEVTRVGKNYFVQTPNLYFPLEPHFLFPFFQFLPFSFRVFLINNFTLGHEKKQEKREDAKQKIKEIQLLSKKEMKTLFPNSNIWEEKVVGLVKSFVAYKF